MALKGKPLSLGAKIVGASIALGGLAAKVWVNPQLDIDAVLKVAAFVPLLFATVDLSLIAESVFGKKIDSSSPGEGV
jgi:hypothetical protein